jgi:hypothetical protein
LNKDEYFVVGDNRDDSYDSRIHGPIKKHNIKGKYLYTYFSIYWDYSKCHENLMRGSYDHFSQWLFSHCPTPNIRNIK